MEVTGDHLRIGKDQRIIGYRVGLSQQYPLSSDVNGSDKRPLPVAALRNTGPELYDSGDVIQQWRWYRSADAGTTARRVNLPLLSARGMNARASCDGAILQYGFLVVSAPQTTAEANNPVLKQTAQREGR